ncbi:hypothetical protein GBA52_003604 [Prunus armeniaca]|nr:hypothetical protein GBA52_003604 [Prunus armeniaca]
MGFAAMEESVMPVVPKFGMNFKEKPMNIGRFGLNKEDLEEDRVKIEDDDFEVSEGSRGPCIRFSEKVKDRLYRPWQNVIIIKLMGKAHAYNFLLTRLKQKWSMLKGLHIEWFNAEAIKRIGDLIGITYCIDTHTIAQARGKYACICVEVDLT